ncbi:MAG TPA: hypothetical protein VGB85_07550 [Nannocystis sp.]|jgi:hypothetical protein
MLSDDATTELRSRSRDQRAPSSPDEVAWSIPPLVLGRTAQAAVGAPTPHLPVGYRLGEHVITEPRGRDGCFELHVVTHAERGSLHMARVLRREHADLAPAMLEAVRKIQDHPQRNLREVLEAGWTDEPTPRAFVVHERLVGRSLASLVHGRSEIEWPLVVAIGVQCAEALEALHELGLAHTHLGPDSAALMHVAGDQFRVVLGGLEHAQAIVPGSDAAEEPRVRDDLLALGEMLNALAAGCCATTSAPMPEALTALLARMVDPRPAMRPMTASEIHEQLAAVHDHVDPQLSSVRMLGEAFRKIACDDFEVSVELDEPAEPARARPVAPVPVIAYVRPAAPRWPSLLLVAVVAAVAFAAGASLPDRPGPTTARTLSQDVHDDREEAPAPTRRALPRLRAQEPTPEPAPAVVLLPRQPRVARVQPRPAAETADSADTTPASAPAPAEPAAVEPAADDESPDPDPLLPVPVQDEVPAVVDASS